MGSNDFLAVSALHLASLRVATSTKGPRGRSLVCRGIPATYDVNESMLVWIIAQSNPRLGRFTGNSMYDCKSTASKATVFWRLP